MVKMESFRSDYSIKYSDRELLSRFWRYLTAYKLEMVIIIYTILLISGFSIVPPLLVQKAYGILEAGGNWTSIANYAISYVGLSIYLWLLQLVQGIFITLVTQKVIKTIQMETYVSLQEHDLGFFDVQATGEIMSRITNDSQELNNMITVVGQFISNFVIVFSVLGIMLAVNWKLGLVTLGMGPVVFIAAFMFRRFTRKTSGKWRAAIAEVNTSFQESVSGISVAKAFGREEKSKEEFEVINDTTFRMARKRALAMAGIWPVMDGISTLAVFSINLFGSWLVLQTFASTSTIVFFILLLNRFLYPLARVASQISTVQSGFAAMERIFSIIDAEKIVKNPEDPVFKEITGRITFDKVDHEYVPN
ncbi:MAG: ABC transporter ATP-binding protein, partial [Asgard group archaeon]|nr:ABC transporter ATP-binding protein [Asgard group archaeon]